MFIARRSNFVLETFQDLVIETY